MARAYHQNCPIALGLDILGERWTLLILRELVGGARRYADLKAALPGIASNLLADRLRELEEVGLVERTHLPPPVARTVYALSEVGWIKVLPVMGALAQFGLDLIEPSDVGVSPLSGFLAGVLLGFDDSAAAGITRIYHADIDDRHFEFAIRDGVPSGTSGPPAVTLTASSTDLIAARLSRDVKQLNAARARIQLGGDTQDVARFRKIFRLEQQRGHRTATRD